MFEFSISQFCCHCTTNFFHFPFHHIYNNKKASVGGMFSICQDNLFDSHNRPIYTYRNRQKYLFFLLFFLNNFPFNIICSSIWKYFVIPVIFTNLVIIYDCVCVCVCEYYVTFSCFHFWILFSLNQPSSQMKCDDIDFLEMKKLSLFYFLYAFPLQPSTENRKKALGLFKEIELYLPQMGIKGPLSSWRV